jgi:SNF2 family DNA or RNA helicase
MSPNLGCLSFAHPGVHSSHHRLLFSDEARASEKGQEGPVKAVIFSQWTHTLDLVGKALKSREWR